MPETSDPIPGSLPEKIEIDFYQFISRELEKLEARMDRRFDEQKSQMNEQFKDLKEEVRWPRRIAIAGVITTVMAVGFAIAGFKS
ncbi:hypothetical protein AGMMS4952_15590 [Spirochaetia bacterium]|nr:hypothetical protein AGMMS4952_15590 [Spirochaetia bacterium]